MTVLFFGTGDLGIPALEALKNSPHQILAVVTGLDKPRGRSLALGASAVKAWAVENEALVLQPGRLGGEEISKGIQGRKPDILVVIDFGMLLPKELLVMPRLASLNVHTSLLPRYRGAAPVAWAIIRGDTHTGVTVMRLTEKLDAGDILLQKNTAILPEEDLPSLESRLSRLGAEALLEAMGQLEKGQAVWIKQDQAQAFYARKLTKADGHVDWNRPAREILNRLRAMKPWPGSYTFYEGKRLIILDARVEDRPFGRKPPGTVLAASPGEGLGVASKDKPIRILTIQQEGKKPVPADEFLRGFKIEEGHLFE